MEVTDFLDTSDNLFTLRLLPDNNKYQDTMMASSIELFRDVLQIAPEPPPGITNELIP